MTVPACDTNSIVELETGECSNMRSEQGEDTSTGLTMAASQVEAKKLSGQTGSLSATSSRRLNLTTNVFDVVHDGQATVRYIQVECPGDVVVQWEEIVGGWRIVVHKRGIDEGLVKPVEPLQQACGTWTRDFVYTDGLFELYEDQITLDNGVLTVPLTRKDRPRTGQLVAKAGGSTLPPWVASRAEEHLLTPTACQGSFSEDGHSVDANDWVKPDAIDELQAEPCSCHDTAENDRSQGAH
eukprot:gnl/TRDRNA2_/TRDRNA2_175553_c0_seq1.p1 gnl/TRDRNA2_/TRDRNA2_175553_c0~~gnl/TRDRNA2_/TRDRNA2_175553_c0_seq1.p1  ORF type:complete len:282 (-),score=44.84 gnl/TRDRNA2_/TRDRNA2_175553_c0_seq1:975-1694(-)